MEGWKDDSQTLMSSPLSSFSIHSSLISSLLPLIAQECDSSSHQEDTEPYDPPFFYVCLACLFDKIEEMTRGVSASLPHLTVSVVSGGGRKHLMLFGRD